MLDLKWIRDNPDAFDDGLKRRGTEPLSAKCCWNSTNSTGRC